MRTLERLHPLCGFAYFIAVLGVSIFTRNPVLLLESAAGALCLLAVSGRAGGGLAGLAVVPLSAVINPLVSHNGATVLFFVGDAAVTLEAVAYGAVFGLMLAAALMWSGCSAVYLTSDKYIWLFGRVLPSAGLTLSCALRFVPLFIRRGREFAAAQGAGSVGEYLRAYSAAVGYSAEEAMSAADSMTSRGYGSARRTAYSRYRLGGADIAALTVTLALGALCAALLLCGAGEFRFYPSLSELAAGAADIALYIAFGALCLLPSAAAVWECVKRAFAQHDRVKERKNG